LGDKQGDIPLLSTLIQSRIALALATHLCIRDQLLPVYRAIEAMLLPCSYICKTYMNMHNDARAIRKNACGKIEKVFLGHLSLSQRYRCMLINLSSNEYRL
jgi:hypothetical protein